MLNSQKNYLNYLDEINKILEGINLPESTMELINIPAISNSIKNTELLIPIVGTFSSGKSSLINSFLGNEYLPVGITPETALATEIRYTGTGNERIEAVKEDSSIDIYKVDEIGAIGRIASKYKFIRLFIKNDKLKGIEPLILVDMPGFESPLDLHNRAIMEYINKGVYYIVLINVEDGTITRSMTRQLEAIKEYKRDFSFFLSKTDLRSTEDTEKIKNLLQEQISNVLNLNKPIIPIDNNSGDSLKQVLTAINPDKLFKDLFLNDLQENFYLISESINTVINALKKSKEDNEQEIITLEKELQSIISQRDDMLKEAEEKYSDINVNSIVTIVGKELSDSIEELVSVAINQGQEAFSRTISEIVRNSLISNIEESMSEIGNEIVDNFSSNLKGIENSVSNVVLPNDFIDKTANSIRNMLHGIQGGMKTLSEKYSERKLLYKTLTTVLAITTSIVTPIVEVLIVFLPDFIGGIIQHFQQKKKEENIRNAIITDIIPSIKRKLREQLPKIFNKQVQDLIKNIGDKFEEEITNKKNIIEKIQDKIKNKISDINSTIELHTGALTKIKALANNSIFNDN